MNELNNMSRIILILPSTSCDEGMSCHVLSTLRSAEWIAKSYFRSTEYQSLTPSAN